MSKMRVYELAKELGLEPKDILAKLRTLKIPIKSHMSIIPDSDIEKVKQSMVDAAGVVATGGVEEKRVAKGVIRRRSKPAAVPEEEEKPKVDLVVLKQAVKKPRLEEEEVLTAVEPEVIKDIPKEWTEEEAAAPEKRKVLKRKKGAPEPEPDADAAAEPPVAPEPPAVPPAAAAPTPDSTGRETPSADQTPAPETAAVAKTSPPPEPAPPPAKPKPAVPKRIYHRPTIRKTARAVEGEPLTLPGQKPAAKKEKEKAPEAKEAEPAALDDGTKKKKKKKKKKKGEPETAEPSPEQTPAKKKLRRKIAFKMQGSEGMEIADVEQMYLPSRKKSGGKKKVAKKTQITTPKAQKRVAKMGESISVLELARQLEIKSYELIRALSNEGIAANDDYLLDADAASVAAATFNYEVTQDVFDEVKLLGEETTASPENQRPRPPVVTVMGHVDHGKTSLLDTIRKTRVTEEEAGAITQHIGASVVETSSGRIVFIDTPGHEAFTSMRSRGARVTDIVVLVVAADDGIMPQTVEAANHAKAAGVPIIVAINKIDLPAANPGAVKQRLSELGLTPEDWGGETLVIECSAKTGQGVPDLLEHILLQAEILDLKANPTVPAKCFVIESQLDKGRGPVATVIVQEGTLRRGDYLLAGLHHGKVRAMLDDLGNNIPFAEPSIPVEIMGLDGVPEPGEVAHVVDERSAKLVAEHRELKFRESSANKIQPTKVSLEDLVARLEQGEVQELALVIKTDTHGSGEAIKAAAERVTHKDAKVNILHVGVGAITENDVLLASASNAVILGFNVKAEAKARKLAETEGVQIRNYDVIYHLLDDVKASLHGLLKPIFGEQVIGKAEVRKVFRITKVGAIGGSYVLEGVIKRNASARVLREGKVVHTGRFKSLKRLQDDAKEVSQGLECGIGIENFSDLQENDLIEAFEVTEQKPAPLK